MKLTPHKSKLYEPAPKATYNSYTSPLLHMYTLSHRPVYTMYGYIGTDVYEST